MARLDEVIALVRWMNGWGGEDACDSLAEVIRDNASSDTDKRMLALLDDVLSGRPNDYEKAGHKADCEGMIYILDSYPPHYCVRPGTCTCGKDQRTAGQHGDE